MRNVVYNEGLRHPSKNEIAEIILNPPDPPWFLLDSDDDLPF
jgi:hypothetical protein